MSLPCSEVFIGFPNQGAKVQKALCDLPPFTTLTTSSTPVSPTWHQPHEPPCHPCNMPGRSLSFLCTWISRARNSLARTSTCFTPSGLYSRTISALRPFPTTLMKIATQVHITCLFPSACFFFLPVPIIRDHTSYFSYLLFVSPLIDTTRLCSPVIVCFLFYSYTQNSAYHPIGAP